MRKEFSLALENHAKKNEKLIFITGDLGFMALENVQSAIGSRFINAGVSEQNMTSIAAALASEGFLPICYSIAPFAVFRPAEQIRLDVCLHNMNVKIVGNGGGYGYGIMGATHHALEDLGMLSSFQNMRCFVPFCNEDVDIVVDEMMRHVGPSYLRLGFGKKPETLKLPHYEPLRKLVSSTKPRLTIIGVGPVILNVLSCIKDTNLVDVFVVTELPLKALAKKFIDSLKQTSKLIIVEEHVKKSGVGEHLSALILESGITCKKFAIACAKGYPNGLYGSQIYHQQISELDSGSLSILINDFLK